MKKFKFQSLLLPSILFIFTFIISFSIFTSNVSALTCNLNNPDDHSQDCVITLSCQNGLISTSQGCSTPFGCSGPSPAACTPINGSISSNNPSTPTTPTTPSVPTTGNPAIPTNTNVPTGSNNNSATPTPCLVQQTANASQTCSVPVSSLSSSGTASASACQSLAQSQTSSNFQQNVTGTGPVNQDPNSLNFGQTIVTNYNSLFYATPQATAELASCLGGTVVLTSAQAVNSPFQIPATYEIVLPNGTRENAGFLINQLVTAQNGNVNSWMNAVVNPLVASGASSGSGSSSWVAATVGNQTTNMVRTQINAPLASLIATYKQKLADVQAQVAVNPNTSLIVSVQSPTSTSNASSNTCLFTSDIALNDSGTGVTKLTNFLVTQGLMTESQNTYDQTVFTAVKTYQEAHASSILTPLGLTEGTGFFGPSTRAYVNSTLNCGTQSNTTTSTTSTSSSDNAIFTSNASGTMHVGDAWNIIVTGLNPFEIIYATGGKVVNGVVPTDRTPYSANSFGIYLTSGVHAVDAVGDWQITWTRANGSVLRTINFSVLPAVAVGTKTSNFNYTFTKLDSMTWKVTLDNAALGTPSDFFYIQPNYFIIATSSASLNYQNQYRFNLMSYFPGTPSGNTFYSEMFNAFTRAYYDWANQAK